MPTTNAARPLVFVLVLALEEIILAPCPQTEWLFWPGKNSNDDGEVVRDIRVADDTALRGPALLVGVILIVL